MTPSFRAPSGASGHAAPSGPAVALAAPHLDAVRAARAVVAEGGNAVDAAVCAAAVLTVVYPHMCSVGGDLIALVRSADGTQTCVNASGAYGSGASVDELFAGVATMPVSGPLTVSVPGTPSGWATLLERWGSLPAARVLAPAIALARDGMVVSPGLAGAILDDREALFADPGMRAVFFADGVPAAAGTVIRQPALAATLESLAADGLPSFYTGAVSGRLAAGFAELGVPVTAGDLAAHEPRLERPLTAEFAGLRVSTAAPNSQGYTMLRTLGALEVIAGADPSHPPVAGAPSAPSSRPSPSVVDAAVLAELFHSGDVLRDSELADPLVVPVDVAGVLSPPALADAASAALAGARTGARAESVVTPRPGGDTIAVTAVAADGTAVSLIQSVFHSFGSLLLEPSTGLVLHNRAAFFTLQEGAPNRVAAGKRPAHTLMPVLVETAAGQVAAHGTMGGKAQSQIHAQLLLRVLEGASPHEAVTAPRFIVGGLDKGTSNDYIVVEPTLPPLVREQLERGSLRLVEGTHLDSDAGHAMIARLDPSGLLSAGADPRSDGGVFVS
ncbi:gamma-glutamyltransferase [Herbiconiux sp.]|uniref:gamma-glutamyltransferase family protein n=1 Tax=Herbiconiux sp. TaxID=1871186 RepID=UPI0025C2281B|nr:gamma-glutamyltransferase [Herbiconiux sp.]